MKSFITKVSNFFARWFHKRNIIIVSERKVKHIPIGGPLQFAALLLLTGAISWASYSTGSYIAARSALKEQGQALRSVTNAHIETSFSNVYQANVRNKAIADVGVGPYKKNNPSVNVEGPVAALSALDNAKLVARITLLEGKVIELKNTNEAIVQRVQDKTAGKLEDLESIIKHTGLNMSELKREYMDENHAKNKSAHPSEGGPYIPVDTIFLSPQAKDMLNGLDNLVVLSQIVSTLPLSKPIHVYGEQSAFGHRIDPFNGHMAFHSGLDMAGPIGSKIYSTADGEILSAGRNGAYGNAIDIDHGFGVTTRYGHLSEVLVHEGQQVKKGEVIGIQGMTGRATGPHLHYEVRYHDQAVNPKNFLEAQKDVSEEQ